MTFDYGKKLSDGQHERHPAKTNGDFVAPVRKVYVHKKCNTSTSCPNHVAETYAKHPNFYDRTFCVGCRDYLPISEFHWKDDGVQLGKITNDTIYTFYVDDVKYTTERQTASLAYVRTVAEVEDGYVLCIPQDGKPTEFVEKLLEKFELNQEIRFYSVPPACMN